MGWNERRPERYGIHLRLRASGTEEQGAAIRWVDRKNQSTTDQFLCNINPSNLTNRTENIHDHNKTIPPRRHCRYGGGGY